MTSQLCKRATAAPSARANAKPSAPYGDDSAAAAAAAGVLETALELVWGAADDDGEEV